MEYMSCRKGAGADAGHRCLIHNHRTNRLVSAFPRSERRHRYRRPRLGDLDVSTCLIRQWTNRPKRTRGGTVRRVAWRLQGDVPGQRWTTCANTDLLFRAMAPFHGGTGMKMILRQGESSLPTNARRRKDNGFCRDRCLILLMC